jgi:hypothetical protein
MEKFNGPQPQIRVGLHMYTIHVLAFTGKGEVILQILWYRKSWYRCYTFVQMAPDTVRQRMQSVYRREYTIEYTRRPTVLQNPCGSLGHTSIAVEGMLVERSI